MAVFICHAVLSGHFDAVGSVQEPRNLLATAVDPVVRPGGQLLAVLDPHCRLEGGRLVQNGVIALAVQPLGSDTGLVQPALERLSTRLEVPI